MMVRRILSDADLEKPCSLGNRRCRISLVCCRNRASVAGAQQASEGAMRDE